MFRQNIINFAVVSLFLMQYLPAQEIEEKFNPDKLKDFPPEWPEVINPVVKIRFEEAPNNFEETEEENGFRVQVITTNHGVVADSIKKELENKFTDSVYTIFDAPNYKVRVGNFIDRNQAQQLLFQVQSLGYNQAWIIRTRVIPPQEPYILYP